MKNIFKEMSQPQLKQALLENYDSLQNLKFQQSIQQIEDTSQISKIKKDIARIKTLLKSDAIIDDNNQGKVK